VVATNAAHTAHTAHAVGSARDAEVEGHAGAGGSAPDAEIRDLVKEWAHALHEKDVTARTANYADDVELFDVVGPLRHHGLDALRARLGEWFATFEGPVGCEILDLTITAADTVAFCHLLERFSGTTANGPLDMWVRFTVGLQKSDERWVVTHEHASVPFDVETGLASLDLLA
jgi:uncharacterized protein (TIGR02246 family)